MQEVIVRVTDKKGTPGAAIANEVFQLKIPTIRIFYKQRIAKTIPT